MKENVTIKEIKNKKVRKVLNIFNIDKIILMELPIMELS